MSPCYVVGADGGNSKTDLVLADSDGTVLARVLGPGTQPLTDGLPATADALAGLARQAVERAGLAPRTPLAAASFLLANVDLPDEEEAMHAALAARSVAGALEVGNDTLAVLRAGSRSGWGIAVVSGAGINAVGRTADGRVERFLGLGGISGDWGGGWAVGEAAIGAAVRAGDGRGAPTRLRDLLRERFDREPEAVSVAVHRGEIPDRALLDLAPAVFDVAATGDDVAVAIVHRLGDEIVSYVRALARRLDASGPGLEVVLGGGVLHPAHAVLMEHVRAEVGDVVPGASVRVLDVAPVAGAVVSALERVGAAPAAATRARAALALAPSAGFR